MTKPQKVKSIIYNKNRVSAKVVRIDLEHIDPQELTYKAGQFVSLSVGDGEFRSYSICSDSKNTRKLSLIISVEHNGLGANYIKHIQQGDVVEFIGPSGKFVLKKPLVQNLHFFATGTGIAPFISMFWELLHQDFNGNIVLYHGVRTKDELLFLNTLSDLSQQFPSFRYELFLSKEDGNEKYRSGRVTNAVGNIHNFSKKDTNFYLCGNPNMVEDATSLLKEKNAVDEQIIFEEFTWSK